MAKQMTILKDFLFSHILLSRFSVALFGLSRDTESISYIYEKIYAGWEEENMERQPCDSI